MTTLSLSEILSGQDRNEANVRRWIANAGLALELWNTRVKADEVARDLGDWVCGTQACFGGWAAQWPEFQALGLQLGETRYDRAPRLETYIGGYLDTKKISKYLFGDYNLFRPRYEDEGGTDHEVVQRRLLMQLEELHIWLLELTNET